MQKQLEGTRSILMSKGKDRALPYRDTTHNYEQYTRASSGV